MNIGSYTYAEKNSRWIIDINIKATTTNLWKKTVYLQLWGWVDFLRGHKSTIHKS